MKLGIDWSQPSTIRGAIGVAFAMVSLWFLHKGDMASAAGAIAAGKFAQGAMGVAIKD
jgi:hypothetical protein